jgi:hypothetical protein
MYISNKLQPGGSLTFKMAMQIKETRFPNFQILIADVILPLATPCFHWLTKNVELLHCMIININITIKGVIKVIPMPFRGGL